MVEPEEVNNYLLQQTSAVVSEKQKATKILLRPDVSLNGMIGAIGKLQNLAEQYNDEVLQQAEIQIKYERYIEKEEELAKRISQLEELNIPDAFDYNRITALSNEALQKFKKIKPRTLGQASRISGVNPSDIQMLMVYIGR